MAVLHVRVSWSGIDGCFPVRGARRGCIGERLSFGSLGLAAVIAITLLAAGFAGSCFAVHEAPSQAVAAIMSVSPG